MKNQIDKNILSTILLTILFPFIFGNFLNYILPLKIINIPLHSGLEVAGGIIAIVIAMMFYIQNHSRLELNHFSYTSLALLAMGIIDIFHGIVMPGEVFIWLHSFAVFTGGMLFMSVWLKNKKVNEDSYKLIPFFVIISSITFSIISISSPSFIPAMLNEDKTFSSTANFLNICGGIGFFIAALRFILEYKKTRVFENLLLAGHTMLFGVAGILFLSSVVWDMQWWLWHILRLLAYSLALYFLYIEFNKKMKEISHMSITDGLTGVFNRRHFTNTLPEYIQKCKKMNSNLNLIIMDIDYFKQYNDTYGHHKGDEALINVSKCIQESIKEHDICFRMGGEEFAILFENDDKNRATEFANSLKEKIEMLDIEHTSSECSTSITASMGLFVQKATEIKDDLSPYNNADKLMYEAKQNGRNRLVTN